MIKLLKHNLCFVMIGALVIIVLLLLSNAIHDGIIRTITQNQIDDTYRIHK